MINLSDVATGLLGLGVIAGAVGLVALGGRDRTADQHDVADYRPTLAPARRDWPLLDRQPGGPRRLRPGAIAALVLPPIPVAGNPLYADTAAALDVWPVDADAVVAVVADRYGDSPADRAARFLREIAAEQHAKSDDVIWGSRATDRDLTGAFPVVAVA